jgi:ribosomal protein S18 acetylase RimI-like enzyme
VSSCELIRQASTARDFLQARALFEEYAAWLDVDLCFQNFEQELASLPGAYAPPRGRLLLAGPHELPVGCIALRPLPHESQATAIGEIKRLYVRPEARSSGLGRSLVETLLAEARAIGYRELKLDTLAGMTAARTLYTTLGFRECEAYYPNPLHGTVYMTLALE